MGVVPILDMGLKLWEGTGAVLALPILRSAAAIMSNMAALNDIL
jgi:nicotinate-nucleotide--dimethylbenzimidazole phosphoribosyltransferase